MLEGKIEGKEERDDDHGGEAETFKEAHKKILAIVGFENLVRVELYGDESDTVPHSLLSGPCFSRSHLERITQMDDSREIGLSGLRVVVTDPPGGDP